MFTIQGEKRFTYKLEGPGNRRGPVSESTARPIPFPGDTYNVLLVPYLHHQYRIGNNYSSSPNGL